NDMSHRLLAAGYRLIFCREAPSVHGWREGLAGYVVQEYRFGYGRLDLVAKYPHRAAGDTVSPFMMMSHPLAMCFAVAFGGAGLFLTALGSWVPQLYAAAAILVAVLAIERFLAGIAAVRRFRTFAPLLFPVIHMARD